MKKLLLSAAFLLSSCSLASAQWGGFSNGFNNGPGYYNYGYNARTYNPYPAWSSYPTYPQPAVPRYPVMMPYTNTWTGRVGAVPIYPIYPTYPTYQPQSFGFGF